MSDVVAIAYRDLATAQVVVGNLAEAQQAHVIELEDLVIVEHRANGKIKLRQPSLAGAGALGGAAWGGLIGLLFFVPFLGLAMGAAAGAAAGAASDTGVDDSFMKELGTRLQPGGAAVIMLVRNANMEKLLANVKIPGDVIQSSLSSEAEGHLREALARAGQPA